MKTEQISLLTSEVMSQEDIDDICRQSEMFQDYDKKKRKWENAFQKWSDRQAWGDGTESYGACGYGSMCDYCKDNTYGRPCVRALNEMCRDKGIRIDYDNYEFEEIW